MKWLSGILTVGTFAVLYYFEKKRPLRQSVENHQMNTARNLAIAAFAGAAMTFLEKPVTDRLTVYTREKNFGLLKLFRLPKFLEDALAVVLMDYTLYIWHYLTHKSDFLWRFHRVHHADLDLTAATAIRFHFGEIAISVLWRAGQVLVIGVSPEALKFWQTALLVNVFFHHSNVELPFPAENRIRKFIMTPRLHGIHHSEIEDEMNSNWSSGLTIWDRLHGTYLEGIPQNEIRIGVKGLEDEEQVGLGRMLAEPFIGKDER
jgi:sterol desaturase/sphingolipid hydroxylase (fatty acid hydroxylase superfamily)